MGKRALLVGINDYQGIRDLKGCINDVTNIRDILKTYLGFTNKDIRVLVDDRATKANIDHRLEEMVAQAKSGDFLIFHFSGHGSQIRDRDGDELNDHMDELLCPYDMDWDDRFITDDHLSDVFANLPQGVSLEVFLDCCHSGTGTRDIGLERPAHLGPENPIVSRYLPPPVDIECRLEGEEYDLNAPRGFKSKSRSTLNHVLWAGCMDNQTSADASIKNAYHGAFTYYFCKHMRDANGNLTRAEMLRRVRASLRYGGYSQIPQLEGKAGVLNKKVLTPIRKK
jgi:hypothetical protein